MNAKLNDILNVQQVFETINGQLCLMLEKPDAINEFSKTPCVIAGKWGGGLKKYYILGSPPPNPSMSILAEEFEIIGYPVAEGSKEWALWQAENGKSFVHKDAKQCRIFTMFSERELRISDGEGETVEYVEIDKFLNDAAKDGWRLYEPKPTYKVGDWVEIEHNGERYYRQVISIDGKEVRVPFGSGKMLLASIGKKNILGVKTVRKLEPSEVIVNIGCLGGTVRPVSTNGIHIWFHLIDANDKTIATIRITALDAPTRELVKALLKAQEEK